MPRRARIARAMACGALALLAGCATLRTAPPAVHGTPDAQRRAQLQSLASFSLRGQVAATDGRDGFSAQLAWTQSGDDAHATLRSPLGLGGAQLDWQGGVLRMVTGDGQRLEGEAAGAGLQRALGFVPPLASLRYWLLAVPDPAAAADEQADGEGRPVHIQQSGWSLDYGDYQLAGGRWLPGRVTLARAPLRLKLKIAQWSLP